MDNLILIDFDNTLVEYNYEEMEEFLFGCFKDQLNLRDVNVPKLKYKIGEKEFYKKDEFLYLNEVFIVPAFWCQRYLTNSGMEHFEAWEKVFKAMEKVFKNENNFYYPIVKSVMTPVTKWLLDYKKERPNSKFILVTNSPKWIVDRVQLITSYDYTQHFDYIFYNAYKPTFFSSIEFKNICTTFEPKNIYMIGDGILSDNISARSFAKRNGINIETYYYNTTCQPKDLPIDDTFNELLKNLKTFDQFCIKFNK